MVCTNYSNLQSSVKYCNCPPGYAYNTNDCKCEPAELCWSSTVRLKWRFHEKKLLTDALRLHCLDFAITSFFSTRLTSCGTGWHLWRERKKVLCRSFFPVFNENDSTQINKLKSCTLNCIWSTLLHFFEETPIQKVLFHATNLWNFSRLLLHYLLLNMMLVEFKKKFLNPSYYYGRGYFFHLLIFLRYSVASSGSWSHEIPP